MLTRFLAYLAVILSLTTAALGYGFDRDERALGAVPAQIQLARTQDAKAADDMTLQIVTQRVDARVAADDQRFADQVKADAAHEKTMLTLQKQQDLALLQYGEATNDKASMAWAAQPIPGHFHDGLCATFGDCPPAGSTGTLPGAGGGLAGQFGGPIADGGGGSTYTWLDWRLAASRDHAVDWARGL